MLVGYYIIKYFYGVIVNKKAFSLFELILVVILIGLVYSLVLGKINNKNNLKVHKLKNLKSILLSYPQKKIELIVYDKCKRVSINGIEKDFDTNIFKDIEVYDVEDERLIQINFDPYIQKEKVYDVCLRFNIYKNKSSSSYIIKKNNKYILFYPYFKNSEVYLTEDEAIEAFTNKKLLDIYHDEK